MRRGQAVQFGVVERRNRGKFQEARHHRQTGLVGGDEYGFVDVPAAVALVEDGVEVMAQKFEAGVHQPSVERVVVAAPAAQRRLGVFHERESREVGQPFGDVRVPGHGVAVNRIAGVGAQGIGQVDEVAPVVLAAVGVLGVAARDVGRGVGALITQVGGVRTDGGAIDVAVRVSGEVFAGPFVVDRFDEVVGAKAGPVAADGHVGAGEVDAVEPELADAPVGGGQPGFLREDAADELGVDEEGVEIDGGEVVPRMVTRKVDPVILHRRAPAAGAADAHPDVVSEALVAGIDTDESGVELRVALVVHDEEALAFGGGHDQAHDGLAAGVDLVVDLELGVGLLDRGEEFVEHGRGPGAQVHAVGGLHVVFGDRAVGLDGEDGAKKPVASRAVAVGAVVKHRGAGEGGGIGGGDVAMEESDRDAGWEFVNDAGSDDDLICGAGHNWGLGDVVDERRAVGAEGTVGAAGRAVGRGAGGPVLPVVEGQGGVDQLQRRTGTVVRCNPVESTSALIQGPADAGGPVAAVGVARFRHDGALGIGELDALAAVAELAEPVADDIGHGRKGILRLEGGEVGGDDEVAPGGKGGAVGNGEVDAVDEAPAGKIY